MRDLKRNQSVIHYSLLSVKKDVEEIHKLSERLKKTNDSQIVEQIESISNRILEEL